jgi:hypothetical protein
MSQFDKFINSLVKEYNIKDDISTFLKQAIGNHEHVIVDNAIATKICSVPKEIAWDVMKKIRARGSVMLYRESPAHVTIVIFDDPTKIRKFLQKYKASANTFIPFM